MAILVFLAMAFKLTHVFSRNIVISWFVATPVRDARCGYVEHANREMVCG